MSIYLSISVDYSAMKSYRMSRTQLHSHGGSLSRISLYPPRFPICTPAFVCVVRVSDLIYPRYSLLFVNPRWRHMDDVWFHKWKDELEPKTSYETKAETTIEGKRNRIIRFYFWFRFETNGHARGHVDLFEHCLLRLCPLFASHPFRQVCFCRGRI